jgi:hypothetical protein
MGIEPADSAGKRPKQCNILFGAAGRWIFSATTFLGICRTKRNKHSNSKRILPVHKRHRAAESELNEHLAEGPKV